MTKILIVEDNAKSRYMLERLLESKGHHITAAENGEEALRLARQDPPEVIISDIMMPVMNGFKLCCEVKKDSRLRHIPFIFYTATFVDESDKKLALSLGASRFVIKPAEGDQFIQILDDVLKEHRQGVLPVPDDPLNDHNILLEMYDHTLARKLAETVEKLQHERRALIRSQQQLKEAQELAHIGHWKLDLKSNSLEWSDEIYRILGLKPKEIDPSYEAFIQSVHPDDRGYVGKIHKESLSKKVPCDIEYRLVLKDGTAKYVNEKFQTLYNDEGMPTCSMGTVQDITERRRAAERLRFLSSVVEQSSEGMAVADLEGNLIYVNQAWVEMHGYESPEELTGQHLSVFHDPEQLKNEVEPFNEMVMENGYHKGEVGHIRKDGKPFPTLMTTTLIKDESGKPIALSGIAKNIADIKRAEVKLKTERDTLQGLMDGLATTGIGVDIVGLNYRILHQNKVLIEAFGDITGKLCYESYMGLDIPCEPCPMTVAIKSGKVERAEMTSSDGRHYEILSAPLPSPDRAVDKAIEVVLDITERKEAAEALKEANDIINKSSSVAFTWKNQEGWPVAFVSENVERLFGYTAEEFMTGDVDYAGCVHPEDLERVTKEVAEFSSKAETTEFVHEPYRIMAKDGSEKVINDWTYIVRDREGRITHYKGIVEDITDRKEAAEALRESEEKYRNILESMEEGYYEVDLAGNFTFLNDAMCKIRGYTRDELMGMNNRKYMDTETAKKVYKAFNEVYRTQKSIKGYEWKIMRRDGTEGNVEVSVSLIKDLKGKSIGFRGIALDINERKQAEKEKTKLEGQLQQAQKMEAIGTLAGGIAHDFNNILSGIMGYAELAKMKAPEGSKVIADLDKLIKSSERAAALIKQILTISRHHKKEQRPVQVRYIVNEALNLLKATLPTTIEIREDLAKDAGIVNADPTQMHQVIMNLGTNAGHAMQEGGGVLEVSLANVELDDLSVSKHLDLDAGFYLRLTVSDTGYGMTSEIMERIFDPYFTTKDTGEGTGLGLSVAQGIVEAHGGTITVYSEMGNGTTFHVYLPVILEEEREEEESEGPLPTGSERILFIDDEQVLIEIASQMLEQLRYEVVTTRSSVQALELFRAEPDRFDLVITDMTMPRMTGDKLAQELIKIRPDIPVILCTGHSRLVSEEKAKDMGIWAFVMKPISIRAMAETVRRVLDAGRSEV